MGRMPGSLGTDKNSPWIDAGTLARTQSPTPGPDGSYPSSSEWLISSEEFIGQSADNKLWYSKVGIYGVSVAMRQASDRLAQTGGGEIYANIYCKTINQMPLDTYEKLIYEQVLMDKLQVEARYAYYQSLNTPPVPDYQKEKWGQFGVRQQSIFELAVKDLCEFAQRKDVQFVIDLISFFFVWTRVGKLMGLKRFLATADLVTNLAAGECDGLWGLAQGKAVEEVLGLLHKALAYKKVLNLKSESILELTIWGEGKVVGEAIDSLKPKGGSGQVLGDKPLDKYLRIRAFKAEFDEEAKKQMKEMDEMFQKLQQNFLQMQQEINKPPTSPKGK